MVEALAAGSPSTSPPVAPAYPYDFDPNAREQARRFGRARVALLPYVPDMFLMLVLFLLTTSGASSALREKAFSLGFPLTFGAPVFAGVAYVIALAAIIWLAILLPGILISSKMRRAVGRSRPPAVEIWARIGMLPLLVGFGLGFTVLLYPLLWFTSDWWLVVATVLGVAALVYYRRVLRTSRSSADTASVPSALRSRFENLVTAVGFPGITIATSKEEKPSAFTFGLGKSQTVVISREIISKMHPRELDVVMAHEIGHIVNRDLPRKVAVGATLGITGLIVLAILLETAVGHFGIMARWDLASLPLVFLYIRSAAVAFAPLSSYHSQRRELAADRFALSLLGDPVAYMSAQKRLADIDFVESQPPTFTRLFSTHPSVEERLDLVGGKDGPPPGP